MSKIISIITSAPIKYSFNHLDLYDAFDLVSQDNLEAPLIKNALKIIKNYPFHFQLKSIKIIFTAKKGQTLETAKLLINSGLTPNAKIINTPLLNGVNFSMTSLISKEKFNSIHQDKALSFARRVFLEELYKNNLNESMNNLIIRMDKLIYLLKNTKEQSISISHSFFIKLFEIYTKDKNNILNFENLIKSFNPNKKPYEPLSGFDFEI